MKQPPTRSPDLSPKRLLLVASSPSDLTELEDTARVLATRGHQVTVAYFYSGSSRQAHTSSLVKISTLGGSSDRLRSLSIDVDRTYQTIQAKIRSAGLDTNKASNKPTYESVMVKLRVGINTVKAKLAFSEPVVGLREWMRKNGSLARYHGFLKATRAARRRLSKFLMLRVPFVYTIIATLQLLPIYKSYASMFRTLLAQADYQAIVVPEDVVGPFWPTLIKIGLECSIPTIVLPYTLANREEAFKSLRGQADFQTRYNRLAAYLFPRWRIAQDGYDIVRMPAGHILVHQWLGIAPPDPWMMNSGAAKMICVESQASFDYFERAGIPASRLQITGSVSQDSLARQLRSKEASLAALRRELGLTGTKPLLLISGCPNQLAGSIPHCEFSSMQDVAAHLGETLRQLADDYHLVVRPHPNYLEFGDFLRPWGVVSTQVPTSHLVPLCDLFVAFASATIRWAAACGIPTINYDIFHYGYNDFANVKGVRTVCASSDFVSLVGTMKPDSDTYQEARSLSQSDAAYWSVMDGQCIDRIEGVIDAACC